MKTRDLNVVFGACPPFNPRAPHLGLSAVALLTRGPPAAASRLLWAVCLPLLLGCGDRASVSDVASWALTIGGKQSDMIHEIAPSSGALFITGDVDGGAFVSRYSLDGKPAWTARASGNGSYCSGNGMAVAEGVSYVIGVFSGTVTFGGTTLTSAGAADVFVAKVSPSGKFVWAVSAGGKGDDFGLGVTVQGDSLFVVGDTLHTDPVRFGALPPRKARGAFIARMDAATGAFTWFELLDASLQRVEMDETGGCVAGFFKGSAQLGSTKLTSAGGEDLLVARFAAQGAFAWSWALSAGGALHDNAAGLHAAGGDCYVSGEFRGEALFGDTALTASGKHSAYAARAAWDGFVWATSLGGEDATTGSYDITRCPGGAIYFIGNFAGAARLGHTVLGNRGQEDLFVVQLVEATGRFVRGLHVGGPGNDLGSRVACTEAGVFFGGDFEGKMTLGSPFSPPQISSSGSYDILLARWSD